MTELDADAPKTGQDALADLVRRLAGCNGTPGDCKRGSVTPFSLTESHCAACDP